MCLQHRHKFCYRVLIELYTSHCLNCHSHIMPKTSNMPSEGELIFSRASIALSNSQRLIASWLPPKTAAENLNHITEEQLDKEDEEDFKVVPET